MPHGSELHVRQAVEVLDPMLPLDAQEDVALTALDAALGLVPVGEKAAKRAS